MQEGYIEPKIEELTLEKVQGVEGIRALRVKVKTQDPLLDEVVSAELIQEDDLKQQEESTSITPAEVIA
ncbi:MAG: hypothetical protein ACFB15_05890 [Cyclobacteriaceae bacterium]